MRITTEGAVYIIDDVAGTAVRLRRDGGELRRDGEPLPLVTWKEPSVGQPMVLLLRVREDGYLTVRHTSPVLHIEQ